MKKLVIHNFGPIKDVEVELKDINVFIGEQSVGKSVLAKLITILTDHFSLLKIIQEGMTAWNNQLLEYNISIFKDDSYFLKFEMIENDSHFCLEILDSSLSTYLVEGETKNKNKLDIFKSVVFSKKVYHDEAFNKLKLSLEDDKDDGQSIFNFLNNSLYIPAERIIYAVVDKLMPAIMLAKSTISKNLLRFLIELNNAKSEYPDFDMPILGVAYKKEGGDDFFVITGIGRKYPLSVASSGIQSTMPILQVIHYAIKHKEYSTFVIEEPECNLFPSKQVELLEYILKQIKDENRTLTITTHSPYILSAMNNYLFAGSIKRSADKSKKNIDVLDGKMWLLADECSVYSIGESINGEGVYCKSLMDKETGMIDFNSLDAISSKLGAEFEELEDIYTEVLMK